jgi:hypothetical protein
LTPEKVRELDRSLDLRAKCLQTFENSRVNGHALDLAIALFVDEQDTSDIVARVYERREMRDRPPPKSDSEDSDDELSAPHIRPFSESFEDDDSFEEEEEDQAEEEGAA